MEEDRCDNEMEVFNARVHEDEMIISIEEYKSMKDKIENFEKAKKEYQAHNYVQILDMNYLLMK